MKCKISKVVLAVAGLALLGFNSTLLKQGIDDSNLPVIVLSVVVITAISIGIYYFYKVWYYQGKIDALEEIQKLWKDKK